MKQFRILRVLSNNIQVGQKVHLIRENRGHVEEVITSSVEHVVTDPRGNVELLVTRNSVYAI